MLGIAGVVVLLLILIVFSLGFALRGTLLNKVMDKVTQGLAERYQLAFQVKNYQFSGLTEVSFQQIVLIPHQRDTLAKIDQMAVSVRLFPLLFGDVKIGDLAVEHAHVSLLKQDTISNYDFLFQKPQKDPVASDETSLDRNYAALIDGLIKQVFFKIPSNMQLHDFQLSYQDDSTRQVIHVPEVQMDGGDFETRFFLNEQEAQWNLAGYVNPDKQQLQVALSSADQEVELPLLRRKFGLGIRFEKIMFDLGKVKRVSRDSLTLAGSWSFEELHVQHRRLSEEEIVLPAARGKGQLNIGKSAIEVDPASSIQVKEFSFQPYIKYTPQPEKLLNLSIHTGKFEAQQFFDALPAGLFPTLAGIQVSGQIAYDLDFSVNFEQPDSLHFASQVDDRDLKITHWGAADIVALNGPFTYKAYEDTVLMREIVLGSENPKFTPLQAIAPILRNTVLNTEDPYFYQHHGFQADAFRLSIATNIKERAFKRGASTISMQLVKNVFLNRNKTMMRKFEEIALVWLMESSKQVSKDRMLEVYLNVIEWGKNIYGIHEAAAYYFGKQAADLTLGESLFLSSIIPRPKTALASFDYTGHLKPWLHRHFNTYGSIMHKRGQLQDVAVPEGYGFYGVLLQPALRPARPAGLLDTLSEDQQGIPPEHEALMRQMEADAAQGQGLFE